MERSATHTPLRRDLNGVTNKFNNTRAAVVTRYRDGIGLDRRIKMNHWRNSEHIFV